MKNTTLLNTRFRSLSPIIYKMMKFNCFSYTLVFLACYTFFSLQAQEYNKFKQISLEHGLSQASVYVTLEDSYGYLWMGTEDGLNRYDGNEIVVFKHSKKDKASISDNHITGILEDDSGDLWIGTRFGLNKWNRKTEKFENYIARPEVAGHDIYQIIKDKDRYLWVFHENGINILNTGTEKSDYLPNEKLFPNKQKTKDLTFYLKEDRTGKMWFLTDGFVNIITDRGKEIKHIAYSDSVQSEKVDVYDVDFIGGNRFLLTTTVGFFLINIETYNISRYHQLEKHFTTLTDFYDATIDLNKDLWISVIGKGVFKYKMAQDSLIFPFPEDKKAHLFNGKSVLFTDSLNRLWIFSTGKLGISLWDQKKSKLHHFSADSRQKLSLPSNHSVSFSNGRNGIVFIGTNDAGLAIYNPQLEKFSHFIPDVSKSNTLTSKSIFAIHKDIGNRLWLSSSGDIGVYQMKDGMVEREIKIKGFNSTENYIYDFYEDTAGGVWFASQNGVGNFQEKNNTIKWYQPEDSVGYNSNAFWKFLALDTGFIAIRYGDYKSYYYDPVKDEFKAMNFFITKLKEKNIWGIRKISKDRYACVYTGGFCIYNSKNEEFIYHKYDFSSNNSLSHSQAYDVYEDNEHMLWIATANGLNKYNTEDQSFTHYFSADGIANQHIYKILADADNNLWLSTNGGLSKLNPATGSFRNYNVNDGLQSNEFNGGAAFKDKKGILYFGGINGINYFDPDQIKPSGKAPEVNFTALKINNDVIVPGDPTGILQHHLKDQQQIIIPPRFKNFAISFISINLVNSENTSYSYTLEGLDEDWHDLNRRSRVYFNNLPAGEYRLKIKAKNGDRQVSEVKTLDLILKPYFYETMWFKSSASGTFLLLIFAVFLIRIRTIRNQRNKLERQVKERTEEVVKERDEADKQRNIALEQKEELSRQKLMIEQKNKEIIDSIQYAKKIQEALLTSGKYFSKIFNDYFILYKPKDIVSGDFYWAYQTGNGEIIWATCDCTGHGVPGAFMSMVGIALLNEIVIESKIVQPDQILNKLNEGIVKALNSSGHTESRKDGMDMSVCVYKSGENKLAYAGALNSVIIQRRGELIELKPDRQPIGYVSEERIPFTLKVFDLEENDIIYSYTDGYQDQFGGEKQKKFKPANLRKLLLDIQNETMENQGRLMNETFENWKGDLEQIDDVCIIGVRV